jgi:signal transduction histidine kinase
MLRCTQEIITNAVRHAGANRLWLKFTQCPTELRLQARDDGRGSDAPVAGNGLRGMRERVSTCGGRLEITTALGQGFALDVRIPLEAIP